MSMSHNTARLQRPAPPILLSTSRDNLDSNGQELDQRVTHWLEVSPQFEGVLFSSFFDNNTHVLWAKYFSASFLASRFIHYFIDLFEPLNPFSLPSVFRSVVIEGFPRVGPRSDGKNSYGFYKYPKFIRGKAIQSRTVSETTRDAASSITHATMIALVSRKLVIATPQTLNNSTTENNKENHYCDRG